MLKPMPLILEKNNFIWLTIALVGMIMTGQFSVDAPARFSLQLIEFSSVALLILSLLSLTSNSRWSRNFMIIISLLIVNLVVRGITNIELTGYFYLGLMLVFFVTAAWLVAGKVLMTGTVDMNTIVGAIALYLLLGLIWSFLDTITLEVSPNALHGIEAGPWYENLPRTTYFSFVTLTTLGYGDISPASPLAEVLVIFEAVAGMFYLAVIVASLVGSMRDNQAPTDTPTD